jgi:hypothetical protein
MMTTGTIVLTCERMARAIKDLLDHDTVPSNTLLAHGVRDLANICIEQQQQIIDQQRQINRLIEAHGT